MSYPLCSFCEIKESAFTAVDEEKYICWDCYDKIVIPKKDTQREVLD